MPGDALAAKWLVPTNATLTIDDPLFAGVAWSTLEVYAGTGEELAYAIASITGDKRPPYAFGHIETACFHQGSVADSAKPVAKVLVAMLDRGIGKRDEIIEILAGLPFGAAIPRAARTKYNLSGKQPTGEGTHRGLLRFEGVKWQCEYTLAGGQLHGSFVAYWDPGKKAREGEFVHGKKHGTWRYYHAKGYLQSEGTWVDGKKHGVFVTYESLGKKLREETFEAGKLHGPFVAYYYNGQVKERGTYVRGKQDGVWTEWNYDGSPKEETHYKNGKRAR